jgi:hypothetical protein
MNNTELAQLLKDGINDGDSDVIWFVIGELEKDQKKDQLSAAKKAVTDYLKGYNINDPQQVREMAQLKNTVKQLEDQENN